MYMCAYTSISLSLYIYTYICIHTYLSKLKSQSAILCKLSCLPLVNVEIQIRNILQALSSLIGCIFQRWAKCGAPGFARPPRRTATAAYLLEIPEVFIESLDES